MKNTPIAQIFLSRRMATILFLGFCSGLPLALTGGTMQAWMTEEGVDLATIGVLDPAAIAQVHAEVTPEPTAPDALHDLLSSLVATRPRAVRCNSPFITRKGSYTSFQSFNLSSTGRRTGPPSCPADSASGSRSHGHWSTNRRW